MVCVQSSSLIHELSVFNKIVSLKIPPSHRPLFAVLLAFVEAFLPADQPDYFPGIIPSLTGAKTAA
jgi:hypothetical protein